MVSVSLVLLLGAVLLVALRYTRLRLWHAAVCVAFGFCLGKSVSTPEFQNVITTLTRVLKLLIG